MLCELRWESIDQITVATTNEHAIRSRPTTTDLATSSEQLPNTNSALRHVLFADPPWGRPKWASGVNLLTHAYALTPHFRAYGNGDGQEAMRYRMWVASGVSITRTISNSILSGNSSNSRRPPPKSTGT